MKILIPPSDFHIRESKPLWRKDDYYEEQFRKLEWVINIGNANNCELFLQSGDFFDYSDSKVNYDLKSKKFQIKRITFETMSRCIGALNKFKGKCFSVAGNHDQRSRIQSLENTPLKVMYSSGVIKQLGSIPVEIDNVNIYGLNFDEPIHEIKDKSKFNILVAHIMVVNDKLWKQQEEFTQASHLIRKSGYDMIISGDNHQFLEQHYGDKHLFNLGSLMRMTSNQIEHKPRCVVFDTETREYDFFEIPIEDSSKVFDLAEIELQKEKKEESENVKKYYNSLANEDRLVIDFKENMDYYIKENEISKIHADIIYKNMGLI